MLLVQLPTIPPLELTLSNSVPLPPPRKLRPLPVRQGSIACPACGEELEFDMSALEGEDFPLDDIPEMTADSAWVYEHFSRTAVRLARGQSLPFALKEEECKLFLIVPDGGAVTPIGLADKLISSAATSALCNRRGSRDASSLDAACMCSSLSAETSCMALRCSRKL